MPLFLLRPNAVDPGCLAFPLYCLSLIPTFVVLVYLIWLLSRLTPSTHLTHPS